MPASVNLVPRYRVKGPTTTRSEGLAEWQSRPLDPVYAVLFIGQAWPQAVTQTCIATFTIRPLQDVRRDEWSATTRPS